MGGHYLNEQLNAKLKELNTALNSYRKRGEDFARARNKYAIALRKEMLILRDKGMPATILSEVCKGDEKIAELRLQRDIADAKYKSAKEMINGCKLEIKILESQIKTDWSNPN